MSNYPYASTLKYACRAINQTTWQYFTPSPVIYGDRVSTITYLDTLFLVSEAVSLAHPEEGVLYPRKIDKNGNCKKISNIDKIEKASYSSVGIDTTRIVEQGNPNAVVFVYYGDLGAKMRYMVYELIGYSVNFDILFDGKFSTFSEKNSFVLYKDKTIRWFKYDLNMYNKITLLDSVRKEFFF